MQQALFAIIRPQLNLSQPFNQAAHLIEHLLLSHERQKVIGLNDGIVSRSILIDNGYTSELYSSEYYITRQSDIEQVKELLLPHTDQISVNRDVFQRTKAALQQELREERTEYLSLSEQFERAIYTADSPAVQQPWFNEESVTHLTLEEIQDIFRQFSEPIKFELMFDNCQISAFAPAKNHVLPGVRTIRLGHPYHAKKASQVTILIPYTLANEEYTQFQLYLSSLGETRFGLLNKQLRHTSGLIYDLAVFYNFYNESIQITFSCSTEQIERCLSEIRSVFDTYIWNVEQIFPYCQNRWRNHYEAMWGNISLHGVYLVEEAFLGGITASPRERIEKVRAVSPIDLASLHQKVIRTMSHHCLTTIQCYNENLFCTPMRAEYS